MALARSDDNDAESAASRLTVNAHPEAVLAPKSITLGAPGDTESPDKSAMPLNVVAAAISSISSRSPENSEPRTALSFAESSSGEDDEPSGRSTGVSAAAFASVSMRASL